jgi:hypothetical protein
MIDDCRRRALNALCNACQICPDASWVKHWEPELHAVNDCLLLTDKEWTQKYLKDIPDPQGATP